ncbi:DedA family protein [Kineococcus radiotolerans]|uniref:SNARE associated Golgi protein n=1 Tax=Kineococcus radiotolerans (strain ATCC BAA-149 / DSM 14245 / SRS30216) TaxID=266940 RepID=A6W874_KINRD|nr:DedA family protein [Kineococcus radiotolerans]ABS03013.1 SNARE associated Golgi protein [Kineococcus radiotolerans SRS30216 = ATCC BAA-149]
MSTTLSPTALAATTSGGSTGQTGGLTGFVLDTVDALGAPGVGLMSFLEVVFPPIPSEVVLPLAGYQVQQGRIDLVAVVLFSIAGAFLGSLLLYWVGKVIGLDRAARIADRIPLMDASDVTKSAEWFHRHEGAAVFTGRFVPGVRSLISLPAGAARMRLLKFSVLTVLGSGLWNGLLIALGLALGTQYELVEEYGHYLDYVFYAAIAAVLAWAVARRVRSRRREGAGTR